MVCDAELSHGDYITTLYILFSAFIYCLLIIQVIPGLESRERTLPPFFSLLKPFAVRQKYFKGKAKYIFFHIVKTIQ